MLIRYYSPASNLQLFPIAFKIQPSLFTLGLCSSSEWTPDYLSYLISLYTPPWLPSLAQWSPFLSSCKATHSHFKPFALAIPSPWSAISHDLPHLPVFLISTPMSPSSMTLAFHGLVKWSSSSPSPSQFPSLFAFTALLTYGSSCWFVYCLSPISRMKASRTPVPYPWSWMWKDYLREIQILLLQEQTARG